MEGVYTDQAPAAVGPYNQGMRIGNWLYLSAQIALVPATERLAGTMVGEQTHQVMKNIGAILRAAGADYGRLIKTTLYLVNMSDFSEVNAIYSLYVQQPYPARATLGVSSLPKGSLVALEGIAWLGKE
ncbi:MAG: RutC protein [Magnetococcales bacterium]|nr:RutC protein [Magnetococcales bacterium]